MSSMALKLVWGLSRSRPCPPPASVVAGRYGLSFIPWLPLPGRVIQRAVWMYLRFTLSYRDVEDLLAERGIQVSYETIRRWGHVFGPGIARRLRARRPKLRPDRGKADVSLARC